MALHEEASRYKKVFFVTQERMRERERERERERDSYSPSCLYLDLFIYFLIIQKSFLKNFNFY